MGAWGHGSFDNDAAADWFADLADGDVDQLGETLDAIAGADDETYLEVDEASAAIAGAELVAAALGKGDDRLSPDALTWLARHRRAVAAIGAPRARAAVERVWEASELRELWDENGDDSPWHAGVQELLRRLS